MIEKWYNYLKNYQSLHKFPKSWFQYGLWRFKKYSGQWEDFLEKHNIKKKFFKSKNEEELKLEITKGFSPCLKSGYSIKGIFKNKPSNEEILNFLVPLVNNINYDEDLDIISINSKFNTKKYRIIIYSDGTFFFQNFDKNFNNITILKFLTNSVQRAKSCNVCKTCLEICQNSAIFIENNKIKIKQEKCTQCFQCITHCPLYHKTKRLITKLKEFM